MEETWIDHEGRLRIEHDENFQMVSPFEVDSVWHLTDSWDIGQACRLILLGYNEDIKRSIDYGFEHCPEGSTGRDRAHALITIVGRFMTLAKSTIAIGNTLKNPDTPANWLAWAKSKGYKVAHLKRQQADTQPQDTTPSSAPVLTAGAPGSVVPTKVEPTPLTTSPKFSVNKAALIAQHKHEWPTIERDIQDASTNGLSKAAKAGVRDWHESEAVEWARSRNKLTQAENSVSLTNVMSNLPSRKHTIND